MKHYLKLAAASALALCTGAAAWAQDTTLTIASWAPPTHPMNASMWPEFINMIETASGGAVTADHHVGEKHRIEVHVRAAQLGQPGDIVQGGEQVPVRAVIRHGLA